MLPLLNNMILNNNKWKLRIITVLLLLPLFFINVKDSHNWGDDFAQYLIQAKNIYEGKPQTENGLLFNPGDPAYAIEAYPVGFPLLIFPVYALFGIDFFAFSILLTFFLFGTGILIFEFFRKRSTELIALLITLIFCYNVHLLELKKQVLSEIPFTFCLLIILLWYESHSINRKYSWIVPGILFGYLISIRLAGIAFLTGFVIQELSNLRFKNGKVDDHSKRSFYTILSAVAVFWILNALLFPIKTGGLFSFYFDAFYEHEIQLSSNAKFYYDVVEFMFPFLGSWIPSLWILFPIAGWITRLIKNPSLIEFSIPVYVLLIIFYPYAHAGLRFLLPILPFLLFYSGYFFLTVLKGFGRKGYYATLFIFLVPFTGSISPAVGIINAQQQPEDGPQLKESNELFHFIKTTPVNSAIVFCKARAISLYTGRSSLYTIKNHSLEEINNQFQKYDGLYLVIANVPLNHETYDSRLIDYIKNYNNEYEKVWENRRFNVYRQLKR